MGRLVRCGALEQAGGKAGGLGTPASQEVEVRQLEEEWRRLWRVECEQVSLHWPNDLGERPPGLLLARPGTRPYFRHASQAFFSVLVSTSKSGYEGPVVARRRAASSGEDL